MLIGSKHRKVFLGNLEAIMHKSSAYERYIQYEIHRCGLEADEENDFPCWLVLEHETYYWIFRLSRKMHWSLDEHTVSKRLCMYLNPEGCVRSADRGCD